MKALQQSFFQTVSRAPSLYYFLLQKSQREEGGSTTPTETYLVVQLDQRRRATNWRHSAIRLYRHGLPRLQIERGRGCVHDVLRPKQTILPSFQTPP